MLHNIFRYKRVYNKRSEQWSAVPIKVAKEYKYITSLMEAIVSSRIANKPRSRILPLDHPKRIAPNLAKTPAPSTAQLVIVHKSRIKQVSLFTGSMYIHILIAPLCSV